MLLSDWLAIQTFSALRTLILGEDFCHLFLSWWLVVEWIQWVKLIFNVDVSLEFSAPEQNIDLLWNSIELRMKSKKQTHRRLLRLHFRVLTTVYILGQKALSSSYLLYWTGLNWFMGRLGRATCNAHSISAQISQEGIESTKAKSYFPNIYTVLQTLLDIHWVYWWNSFVLFPKF